MFRLPAGEQGVVEDALAPRQLFPVVLFRQAQFQGAGEKGNEPAVGQSRRRGKQTGQVLLLPHGRLVVFVDIVNDHVVLFFQPAPQGDELGVMEVVNIGGQGPGLPIGQGPGPGQPFPAAPRRGQKEHLHPVLGLEIFFPPRDYQGDVIAGPGQSPALFVVDSGVVRGMDGGDVDDFGRHGNPPRR